MAIQNPQSCPLGKTYFYDNFDALNPSKWTGVENVVDGLLYDTNQDWLVFYKKPVADTDDYVEVQIPLVFKFRQGAYFGLDYPIFVLGNRNLTDNFISLNWKQDNGNSKYSIHFKSSTTDEVVIYTSEFNLVQAEIVLKLRIYADQAFAYVDGKYAGKVAVDQILNWDYAIWAQTNGNDYSKVADFYIVGEGLDISCTGSPQVTRLDLETQAKNLKDENIAVDAHIHYSKLNLTGKITDADLSTGELHNPEDTTSLENRKVLSFVEFKNVQTGINATSVDVTSLFSTSTPVLSSTDDEGFVVDSPNNKVAVFDSITGRAIDDGSKNIVYGRLVEAAGVWTLRFYSMFNNVETQYEFNLDTLINIFAIQRTNLLQLPEDFLISQGPAGGDSGSGLQLQDHLDSTAAHKADSITVEFSATNYASTEANVEEHLKGIDTRLGETGGSAKLGTPSDGTFSGGLFNFTSTTKINDAIDDLNEVLTEIAPAQAASLNGTDLQIYSTSTTKYPGNVSAGNINYEGSAGDSVSYIITDATFTLETLNTSFNWADTGTLKLQINGVQVDAFDLGAVFDENLRDGTQTYPSTSGNSPNGFITIVSVSKYNNFKKWQKGSARINIVPANLRQGYNYIKLLHELTGSTQETNAWKLFYDNDTGAAPSVTTPTLTQALLSSSKYLSGLQYYSLNDQFYVNVTGNALFNNVYVTAPIRLAMTGIANINVAVSDSSIAPPLANPPAIGNIMNIVNKLVTINQSNQASNDLRVSATPISPYGSHTVVQSASQNILLNTYGNYSTDTKEYFYDENYRFVDATGGNYPSNFNSIPSQRTGVWISATPLTNNSGEAQVYNGKLVYPKINFTGGYLPVQVANYSSFSGDKVFVRSFYKSSPISAGVLTLTGLTLANILSSGKAKVEIKLPSQTGWLDLGKAFDSGTFTGATGDGCRTSVTGSNFSWSSGSFSTAASGFMILVRVTIKQDPTPVELTYMELI